MHRAKMGKILKSTSRRAKIQLEKMEHPEKQSIIWSKTEAQIGEENSVQGASPFSLKMRKVLRKVMDFVTDHKN